VYIGEAVADRAVGGGGVALFAGALACEKPAGEAVCARGGGGVPAGGGVSDPFFLFTHRFSTGSYTNEVSSPSLALIGPATGDALPSRRKIRPSHDPPAAGLAGNSRHGQLSVPA
jgi:hypothetical protein